MIDSSRQSRAPRYVQVRSLGAEWELKCRFNRDLHQNLRWCCKERGPRGELTCEKHVASVYVSVTLYIGLEKSTTIFD